MKKKEYENSKERIGILNKKKEKTDDEIRETIRIASSIQKYEMKKNLKK